MTDIEIIFDPKGHAANYGLVLGEEHQVLPEGEWLLWARRFTGIDDLFVYYHKITGKFVLSKWIYHPDKDGVGIMLELEAFDEPLDWNPPGQKWLRDRVRPSQEMSKSMRNSIQDRARAAKFHERDGIEEKHRTADWLHRQGHETTAAAFRQRKWSKDESPEFESFTEDLHNSAKGRVITGGT